MKTKVEKEQCIGCGLCIALAGEVFEMDDDGLAFNVHGEATLIEEQYEEMVEEAAESCPTQAITIEK